MRAFVLLALLLAVGGTACGSHGSTGGDGDKIAFEVTNLMIMSADGTGAPTAPSQTYAAEGHVWSPDGSELAYSGTERNQSDYVSVVRADGTHYVRLYHKSNEPVWFTWSGRSDQLAYVDDSGTIHVVKPDGSGRRKLVDGDQPSWSPDGTKIAFVRGDYLRVINSDGTGERKLARLSDVLDGPVPWSSDSHKVAYATTFVTNPKYMIESGGDRIVDMDRSVLRCRVHIVRVGDGSQVQIVGGGLLGKASNQCDIDWAPDGKRIAFSRNGFLYAATADGKRVRRLGRGLTPTWSPDGHSIAVHRGEIYEASDTVYVLDVRRSVEHRIARANELSWSPDGKALVVTRTIEEPGQDATAHPGKFVIETYSVSGRRLHRIWPRTGTCVCGYAAWQPR